MAISHLLYTLLVGALGMTAAIGAALPKNVNAIHVLYVHSLSSAVDPYLYVLGLYLDQRRQVRNELLLKRLQI